jgi:hypothetical protein
MNFETEEILPDPIWSGPLRNLYCLLRFRRKWDFAGRQRYYRRIAKEKRRLLETLGVDREHLRLYCRHLANPHNRYAENNLKRYFVQMQQSASTFAT